MGRLGTGAERIVSFVLGLDADAIPGEVRRAAALHVLDVIGCGLAAHALGQGVAGRSVAEAAGGSEEAALIGLPLRVPAAAAALGNGMLMHALDFDDTHGASIAHVSAVVVPAALAVAERERSSGADFLAAVVGGYEVVTRIATAAQGEFHARGFHPTSVAGVFGAAVAASRLAGSDRATAASALGIAGSMASGLFAYLDAGTQTKPIHAGWAAQAGVLAERLAAAGGEGPSSVLEGRFGLYDAFLGHIPDLDSQLGDFGTRWETAAIAYKPYPACHFVHGVLGAAASLGRLDPGEIEQIVAVVPAAAVEVVVEPVEAKRRPRTPYEAKFSLHYSLSALLVHGRVDLASYTPEAIGDERVLSLAQRITYRVRDFPDGHAAFPGAVEIRLASGELRGAELRHQEGAPENPLSEAAVLEKFRANASLALNGDAVGALEQAILTVDKAADVSAFAALLSNVAVRVRSTP